MTISITELEKRLMHSYGSGIHSSEVGTILEELKIKKGGESIPSEISNMDIIKIIHILRFIRDGMDIDIFDLVEKGFDSRQLAVLHSSIKEGIRIDNIYNPSYDHTIMTAIKRGNRKSIDIQDIDVSLYDSEQLDQIIIAISQGVATTKLINPDNSGDNMRRIRNRLNSVLN